MSNLCILFKKSFDLDLGSGFARISVL